MYIYTTSLLLIITTCVICDPVPTSVFLCPPISNCSAPKACLYAYPLNCSFYIQCNELGEATQIPCDPDGQEWNDNTKECDAPENANCEIELSAEECIYNINTRCNQPVEFTQEEIDNAMYWIQNVTLQYSPIQPSKPPCTKLHVRRDWKCLTSEEKTDLESVIKELYADGTLRAIADLHYQWWPAWHKTPIFIPSHRLFINEVEKRMMEIQANVTMPYWSVDLYGAQPEQSFVWNILGHSGNYSTGYCVKDGIYSEPVVPCLKRHWNDDGTINPWSTLELENLLLIEMSVNFTIFEYHWEAHVDVGGYEGQMSRRDAPYDFLFLPWHNYGDVLFVKALLAQLAGLTPPQIPNYNYCLDPQTGAVEACNFVTDILNGYPNVLVSDFLFTAFGDLCYITDALIKPINNLINNVPEPVPEAIKRMPRAVIEKWRPDWIPYVDSGSMSALLHTFEDVGNCNLKCCPLPKQTYLNETEIGRQQLQEFRHDENFDVISTVSYGKSKLIEAREDLNNAGYCSPYVVC